MESLSVGPNHDVYNTVSGACHWDLLTIVLTDKLVI